MNLNLEIASCVRASSVASICTKCVDICPTNALEFAPHLPAVTPSKCVDCGGCVGICPTGAFSLANFDAINFAFSYFESPAPLSCKTNVPCLAIFSPEELLSLSLGCGDELMLDIGHCDGCDIAHKLYPQIKSNIEEANFLLQAMGKKEIRAENLKLVDEKSEDKLSRRGFLDNLKLENLAKSKANFDEQVVADELKIIDIDTQSISKIKNKNIPNKRKLLFAILKREPKAESYETIDSADISFTSQKYIDEKCTNCQVCYRICPTGALGSVSDFSQINFDSMLCLKCHLCHDVCTYDAIHIQPTFELKEFFEPTGRVLAKFNIKRCNECGNAFTYTSGELICPRCQTEEDEAFELHQNARNL